MSLMFLIGMPGCGKTYLGKKIAVELNCDFIDTDVLIEYGEQRSIVEIFTTSGEQYFRNAERKALLTVIEKKDKKTIIACGGGMPTFEDNLDIMKENGHVVYLQCDLDTLTKRIKEQNNRPLMDVEGDLKQQLYDMYEARMPYYMGSHHIVEQGDIAIDKLKEILTHV